MFTSFTDDFVLRYLRHSWTTSVTAMMLNVAAIVNDSANEANTYYVAPNGDDTNPGTKSEPFRTIKKATSIVHAGDTILVRAGVYLEPVILRFSGREGKPITLKNYPGERTVIQPGERGKKPPGQGVLLQAQEGDLTREWPR